MFNSTTSCFQAFLISAASFTSCKAFLNLLGLVTGAQATEGGEKTLIKNESPMLPGVLCLLGNAVKTIDSSITVWQRVPNF